MLEETYKTVIKEMPIKKYKEFLGIANGTYKGFARIYVLASQIASYTDNRIDSKTISELLNAYQKKKTLSMDEIWNIGLFIQIALIENIKDICEKIYFSQMQKYKVESILERIIEDKKDFKFINLKEYKKKVKGYGEMKYPFIEYLSFRLKKYGKSAYSYINVLEEEVNKLGTSIEDIIKKEHFDIALKKVSMANSILSIKELLRMNFLEIFQNINEVEEILKKDPANVYEKMDFKTKEMYRNAIKEISSKTKISEIYIANKILEICNKVEINTNSNNDEKQLKIKNEKQKHVGYYLIGDGKNELINILTGKAHNKICNKNKVKVYISSIWIITTIIDLIICSTFKNFMLGIILFILAFIPIQQIVLKIINYILGKTVKPMLIPKLDFQNNKLPKEYATFVVIPTIVKSKEKVQELMKKLEVYHLANESENIYFALLGDCSSGPNKNEKFDKEVIEEGIKCEKLLNEKYSTKEEMPKFSFFYRKRFWNGKEECYLGWERKRGLLNQFNEYLLGNEENIFKVNTLETWKNLNNIKKLPNVKYVITLDADTELVLNSGLELIGTMAHILNKPELNKNNDCVINGHALIQPRIGISLDISRTSLFTKIFAGSGGVEPYTNAISDIYQDNFDEGIYTGKGIYDLEVFSKVLKDEIPEDIVLSHDLLEGSYLRCGLATDIMLMDGYPSSYISAKQRLHRWIRGDVQISYWMKKCIFDKKQIKKENPLNKLSKYKIIDNLIRQMALINTLILFFMCLLINTISTVNFSLMVVVSLTYIFIPTILDLLDKVLFGKETRKYKQSFKPMINSFLGSILRSFINLATLPDQAYMSLNAMIKSFYRMKISNKHMLEWTTSEDAEKQTKTDLKSYYINLFTNLILGLVIICYSLLFNITMLNKIALLVLGIIWILSPSFMWFISRKKKENKKIELLNSNEKEYLINIGKKTWKFFKDFINEENNYLPPDNYQEDRKPKTVQRTSSTNIGLGLLTVVASYDLGYENLEDTLKLLSKMLETIEILPKWNGHLYNWYNIKTLEPLNPKYISTVDSGNFISYVYALKSFYINVKKKLSDSNLENKQKLLELLPYWIDMPLNQIPIVKADFTKLYDKEKNLFSIGFNIEENKLTNSYYDLLASEARNASYIAISKKDVPFKHWYSLNRTLTLLNKHKGLISWSGTAFEYLMPNINIKTYEGSLLNESYDFMVESQKLYAKKLGIPWGFSETAFNLKDLNNNYQYKAIGIPWLGLKRGLEDDIVVASYASMLALDEQPQEVIKNLKQLENFDMLNKYGFYESLDFTPRRLKKGEKYAPVKTYMAHHQALILLSINNLFNDNIMQKRFHQNPEIDALDILLQEKMPEDIIITNEKKKKPEKIKYTDYGNYSQRIFNKVNERIDEINAISNNDYLIVMDQKGNGYSKYKDILINKYKIICDETPAINFFIKNIKNNRIWTSNYVRYLNKPDRYEIVFTEDSNKIKRIDGAISTTTNITIAR